MLDVGLDAAKDWKQIGAMDGMRPTKDAAQAKASKPPAAKSPMTYTPKP